MADLFGKDFETGRYAVRLDKRWQLDDLYTFSKAFEQAYFAVYGLSVIGLMEEDLAGSEARVARAFRSYPWRGGYSAVNFFNELKFSVPKRERPKIAKIEYASPGWLDLTLAQEVAMNLGLVVASICGSVKIFNATYNGIYRGITERQLAKLSVEKATLDLDREKLEFISQSSEAMAKILQINDIEKLHESTGNELRSLKILLAIYRRVRILASLESDGKATLANRRRLLGRDDLE